MADPREFVLIGSFVDNGITSSLEKINNSINQLKANLGTFAGKKGSFSDLTQSLGKVIGAHKKLSEEVKNLRNELRESIPVLREYRKEVGKAVSANMHLTRGKFVKKNNPHLQFLEAATKQTRELAQASKGVRFGGRVPRGGGGGGAGGGIQTPRPPRPPRPPRVTPGGGGGYVPPSRPTSTFGTSKFGVSRDETFAFGQTLGYTLGSAMTGAIVQGFQIGIGFMAIPFQHLATAMQERIADESSDVQTAGAMFAISERKNMKMFSNFNQAIRAQQEINRKLAESAAALPGATTEYVQMGKRVLDSMMTVLSKDVAGVSKFAGELGAENVKDPKNVLATLTQKFTEKAVLLGQGSQYRGAYGVPQLLEMLIGSENISENMFNRFAQFRELPIFQSVFRDLEGELSKTGAFSAERIRMVFRLLDEALPNEVVQAHKNTMAGFLEATRSAFLDPEVGLFGLGRKVQKLQVAMVDQYGNFLNKQGQIVRTWDEAYKEQVSIYEAIQKILTGFGLPLSELAAILPKLYEPFEKIISPLQSLFKVAQGFYRNFNIYTREFENLAKLFESQGLKEAAAKMKRTAGARGTLLAISNLLATFGDMSGGKFKEIATKLQDPSADIAAVAKEVMTTLFNSSFMEDLGYQIGLIVGGVINTLAQFLGFTTGALGDAKIIKGMKAGFDSVDGMKAVQFIIQNIFKLLFKAIFEIFKLAPLEFSFIGAVALILPAFVASFSIKFAKFIERYVDGAQELLTGQMRSLKPDFGRQKALYNFDRYGKARGGSDPAVQRRLGAARSLSGVVPRRAIRNPQFPNVALGTYDPLSLGKPRTAPSIPKPISPSKGVPVSIVSVAKNSKVPGILGKAGNFFGAGGVAGLKNPIGMLGKFGTALVAVTGILNGIATFFQTGDIWKSLGAAAGPVIGTIIGTALLGPIGGVIGGWIGSLEVVTYPLAEAFKAIGETIGPSLQSLSDALGSLFKTLGSVVMGLIGAFIPLDKNIDDTTAAVIAMKIALTPVVAAFQLVEQVANLLAAGFKGLQLAVLYARRGLAVLNPFGSEEKRLALDEEIAIVSGELDEINSRFGAALNRHMKWYETHPANQKPGANTTPIPANLPKVSGLTPTAGEMDWYRQQMKQAASPKPPSNKQMSGLQPTAQDMAWYNEMRRKQGAITTPPLPATTAPKEIAQTAANTQQLNQKATTQITQAESIQTATQQTQRNTTVANTTLGNIRSGIMAVSNRIGSLQAAMLKDLNNIQAGIMSMSSLLQSGSLKVQMAFTPPGGGLGGSQGGPGVYDSMASSMGLHMTSGYRPGDPGYHGLNRARDYSNSTGPTPQMLAFATFLANTFGQNLKELIYTPLGYSIKDGVKVPPYAQDSHYNHVHVAYALGANNGKMFTNLSAARNWEQSMVPGSVKVASITGNSREGFGETSVVNNFTITQQPGEDGEALANRVATLFYDAMNNAQSASIFS